jgi:HEAT repeat protein
LNFVTEVSMRRLFSVAWIFTFVHFGAALAADEGRGAKQPAGDLIEQLRDTDPDRVCAAARALANHGSAKEAAPALKGLLKNANCRVKWAAAEALWRLEHAATDLVPVYAELLTATDDDVRAASAWRLGRLGSDARPAVPVLAAALRDESVEVRSQVGLALANLGAFAEPALPALVRALGDEHLDEASQGVRPADSVRRSPALPALVELDEKAIPLLIETFRESATQRRRDNLFERSAWSVRARAVLAFPAFGGRAVAPLLRALEAKDPETRRYAAFALRETAQFNGLPEGAADKLERCLEDSDDGVRRAAAGAMSWVRPSSAKAVAVLAKPREKDSGFDDTELLSDLERMCPHNEAARKLLLRMLGDRREETSQEAYRILAGLELPADEALGVWTKALSHSDSEVRSKAVGALTRLGARAKPATSAMCERFAKETDSYCKGSILALLVAIDPNDPELVPFLIKCLDDPESWVRNQASDCLADLGPRAKAALPALKARLLKPEAKGEEDALDSSKMRDLLGAIVHIAPGSAETAATLLQALRHREIRAVHCPKNTWYMRDRLEDELHATLPAAAPLLREALKDPDADVRRSAALVLLRSGRETETALPILMDKLWGEKDTSGEQSRFQRRVVELLSRRPAPAAPAVAAAWCEAWQTAGPEARAALEPGLLVLQPEALPHLLDRFREAKNPASRRDLARLLAHFEGQSEPILPTLRGELREPDPATQFAAAQALTLLGPDAAEAVPALAELLDSPHPALRAVAARALAGVGRAAKPAVPVLKAMLKDARPEMRTLAADALSRIDPDVSEALAVLRDAMLREKDDGGIRFRTDGVKVPEGWRGETIYPDSIEECLARFGERAVAVLADIVDDGDLDEWSADNVSSQCGAPVRVRAALLLGRLGPDARKAVPALTRALNDRDTFVRDAAAGALGRIGPAAKEAAPAFIAFLERQNRLASAAGPWGSGSRPAARPRAASDSDYGGPFDFRSLGRERVLFRFAFGYGYGDRDPYADIRPAHPYDAPYVLSRIDGEARSALPLLREMARDANHPNRLSAALAIWRSGDESPDLVPAFAAALEAHARSVTNQRAPLSRELRECLAELDARLKPTAGALAEWLERQQSSAAEADQVAVVEALGRLGPDERSHADLLRAMLRGRPWEAKRRVVAALALFRTCGDADVVIPALREVLEGPEEHASIYFRPDPADSARVHAVRALAVLAEKGDGRAGSLLVETAKGDENPHVRVAALEATARRQETNAAAVRGLCALLRHQDAGARAAAAAACGRLGPLARASAKSLRVAAEDSHLAVRQAATQALEAVN